MNKTKINYKIIDEMLVSVDNTHIYRIDKIIKEIKKRYNNIIIFSHDDKIKNFYDFIFNISKSSFNSSIFI